MKGKTFATLAALTPDHLPALVVAPPRVAKEVWPVETDLWRPDLRTEVAEGGPAKRAKVLGGDADVITLSRDSLADAVPFAGKFKTLILDESSGFKNRGTARWKAAKKISLVTPNVWELTGTPSPNGLLDLWAQLYLLDGGKRLGKTLTGFRSRYFTPGKQLSNGVITDWRIRPGSAARIHELVSDICLSMETEGRVRLPPVTYTEVSVPLPAAAMKVYRGLKAELVADMALMGGELHTASNAAVLTSKLAQASAGFLYVDDADLRGGLYDVLHREKLKALDEIVNGTGSPVLVFYRFRAEVEMIKALMPTLVHTVDEPGVIGRWNAGEVPVLLAHPASAGHGLNLQHGGHTIVWTSLPWSLEEWLQANKRLARSGQTRPVVIHTLISPGTVDRAILSRLHEKKSVQQALRDYLESVC